MNLNARIVLPCVMLCVVRACGSAIQHDRTGTWYKISTQPEFTFIHDGILGCGWRVVPFQVLESIGIDTADCCRSMMVDNQSLRVVLIHYQDQEVNHLTVGDKTYRKGDVIFHKLIKAAQTIPLPAHIETAVLEQIKKPSQQRNFQAKGSLPIRTEISLLR
jgi:hypothetical protein